jgi:hypothetical protein
VRARASTECWRRRGTIATSSSAPRIGARRLERLLRRQGGLCHADPLDRARDAGQRHPHLRLLAGTIDTDMQVKIRASGMNMISQIPRANLSPVEHAVRGLVYLCDTASDDLIGEDASMRDEAFRKRVGLG